jgi:hypothetical protein
MSPRTVGPAVATLESLRTWIPLRHPLGTVGFASELDSGAMVPQTAS